MPVVQKAQFKKLHPEAVPPWRAYPTDAGLDLSACLISETGRPSKRLLPAWCTIRIPTGWAVRPPPGYMTFVLSRSGFAAKSIFVTNSPGLIDPDYTGEIEILLHNGAPQSTYIEHGQRIAQLVFLRKDDVMVQMVEELPETKRGTKGFGSTGV